MKLSMNWRWNTRKISSSGVITSSVAALTSVHCTPISNDWAKIDSPTVSGRFSTELVIISGQRKLFH
ncbi:hypothetical protein D3C86_1851850 [compost metagenome]